MNPRRSRSRLSIYALILTGLILYTCRLPPPAPRQVSVATPFDAPPTLTVWPPTWTPTALSAPTLTPPPNATFTIPPTRTRRPPHTPTSTYTVTPIPIPTLAAPLLAVVADGPLNLRAGPSKTEAILLQLPTGTGLTLYGFTGDWALVETTLGERGFVLDQYLLEVAELLAGPCREGRVLANVHDPERLRVINPCLTVRGVVTEISVNPDDGDVTFRLSVDEPYGFLLNEENWRQVRGYLQVEIIPADQALVGPPIIGDHVRLTGAYVLDKQNGWTEIHPVWEVITD